MAEALEHMGVEDVAETLRMARERGRSCVLLLGAGCSVTAGIPAAQGIIAAIRDQYRRAWERAEPKTYSLVMSKLASGERRDLIAHYVDEAKINWAHVCIAQLMREGFVDRILTTNFDPLVIRACSLVGSFPAVYDFAASQLFSAGDIPNDAVVYLHGQRTGFVLLNTAKEVEEHAEKVRPVFDEAGQGRVWIVVGYSGENDPVFKRLAEFARFDHRLYWVGYGDGEPPPHVTDELLSGGKDAFYVGGFDADGFFVRLAQELQCFPPDFIGKPFSYLDQLMDSLSTSVEPQLGQRRGREFMSRAKEMIRSAVAEYETGEVAETERRVGDLLLAGKLEEVANVEPTEVELSEETVSSIAWAHILEGNRLGDEAMTESGANADLKFAAAYEKYQAALDVKPDVPEALGNWAITLTDHAGMKGGIEADGLYGAAYDKYAAALKLAPGDSDKLGGWANALANQAKTKQGAEADELFAASYEKYEAALEIAPNDSAKIYNWALALANQAKTKQGAEADELFAASYAKSEAALALAPDDVDVLGNWALALANQAGMKEGTEADELFAAAYEKYEAAFELAPEDSNKLFNWALALADQAKTKEGDEADRLFASSYEKSAAALALTPDDDGVLGNWAIAVANQARTKEGAEADALFADAYEKYEAALALAPQDPDKYENWAIALANQARMKEDAEADELFAAAYEKYETALELAPNDAGRLRGWADALGDQAKTKDEPDADELFAAAYAKYETARALAPDDLDVLGNWAITLRDQAGMKEGAEAEQLLAEAERLSQLVDEKRSTVVPLPI